MEFPHTDYTAKGANQAFWRGFVCGMAAPIMLFSQYAAPEIRKLSISPMYKPAKNDIESLRGDMLRVGNDMRSAIRAYAEE